jgi:ribosome-binding protein aMBF1 (putative translation factor)
MPSTPDSAAFNYAERIRERLPRTLQEEREAAGMSPYALEKKCGVSRDMIGDIESGDSIPTLYFGARMVHGLGLKLWEFVRKL